MQGGGSGAAERYFPAATAECPTYTGDSEWQPIIDGADYFETLSELFARAGAGDTVTVAGLEVEPSIDLHGRAGDDPAYEPLGEVLAAMAARGVDVRVLIACRVLAASLPLPLSGGFRDNALRAERLRAWRPAGHAGAPPLAGRVLLDHSGALLGSNHQKVVATHVGGELVAFVGGTDLTVDRYDRNPHDTLRNRSALSRGARWGWHDATVRVRGTAAERVWDVLADRWHEARTLPHYRYRRGLGLRLLNPGRYVDAPGPAPRATPVDSPGTSVRVLRSFARRKHESLLPWRRIAWDVLPPSGYQEVFHTAVAAIQAARRYVYVEDQYLHESPGANASFELYPYLLEAARRGVKVVLVGSGTRDPDEIGVYLQEINRTIPADVRTKILERLTTAERRNVAVYRVENVTVHTKLIMVDDAFANIGSANMFSRSMGGTDCELSVAIATDTAVVRDLRIALWAEHLRAPMTAGLHAALADLDLALGVWRAGWLPSEHRSAWRTAGSPVGFQPYERVLQILES